MTLSVFSTTLFPNQPGSARASATYSSQLLHSLLKMRDAIFVLQRGPLSIRMVLLLEHSKICPSFEIYSASSFSFLRVLPNSIDSEGFTCIFEYADFLCLIVSLKIEFAGLVLFSYCFVFFLGLKGHICDLSCHVLSKSPKTEILKEAEGQVSK